MGRVRTKLVKKASRVIIEKYYGKLTLDFEMNKKVAGEVASVPSKRIRNKIGGFITHLMKRIQRGGSVRGISLKLQEEERERRLDFLPEKSCLELDQIDVDQDTYDMLTSLGFADVQGINSTGQSFQALHHQRRDARPQQGDRRQRDRDAKPKPAGQAKPQEAKPVVA